LKYGENNFPLVEKEGYI